MKRFIKTAYTAAKLFGKANAPTIMVVGGVVSMGVGTVVACKKTLHLEEALQQHTNTLDAIADGERLELEGYTPDKASQDRYRVYGRVTRDMVKLYAVPGVLFIAGAGLVFKGHHIMIQRNATLAIAFTSVSKAFAAYRQRAVETMGSDFDQAMLNGWKVEENRDADGVPTGETRPVRDWEADEQDPYNRVFEQGASSQWENDLGVNMMFLRHQQKMAQFVLADKGVLYLSDVYKALGFPESDFSRVCGWKVVRLPDGSKSIPIVDFGLDKPHPEDWVHNRENAVYLDFNVQGLIVGGRVQKILENA